MKFDIDESEWQQLMETIKRLRNENKDLKEKINKIKEQQSKDIEEVDLNKVLEIYYAE